MRWRSLGGPAEVFRIFLTALVTALAVVGLLLLATQSNETLLRRIDSNAATARRAVAQSGRNAVAIASSENHIERILATRTFVCRGPSRAEAAAGVVAVCAPSWALLPPAPVRGVR